MNDASYERALYKIEAFKKINGNSGCCCVGIPGPTGPTGPAGGATGATD